jgi:sugar lactone lactonase YvrE
MWRQIMVLLAAAYACGGAARQIATFADTGEKGYAGDGGPATQARLDNPFGIVKGPGGAIYVCDTGNHVIRRIATNGIITTVAGTGKGGYSGDGGPALKAELKEPYEVRFDKAGNMYFVEMRNHVVRRVDAETQTITTLAGTGKAGYSGDDGPARSAMLNQPHSIQLDSRGDLYISDILNHRIRRVDAASGMIFTFGGTGEKGNTADGAKVSTTPLHGPRAIDFDANGDMWVALREGNAVYRVDMKTELIHHLAGTGHMWIAPRDAVYRVDAKTNAIQYVRGPETPGPTPGTEAAKRAAFAGPKGISVGPDGVVYLAETERHIILAINAQRGVVEHFAGSGARGNGPDGDALKCRMARPHGVFADTDGSLYIGDSEAHRVRVVMPSR